MQQILSVIAQKSGASATELWTTLVKSRIFAQVGSSDFTALLHTLGVRDLITQDHGGSLLPGVLGEKLINQFDFYSASSTVEEFRLIAEGHMLGSLPIERPLTPGQRIIFGGRRWKVQDIDTHGKVRRLNVSTDWVWDHSSRKKPLLPVIRMAMGCFAIVRAALKPSLMSENV
ncbi:MAG TPA: hypothetical protein VFE22_15580 [Edaphobacter sp.]|nr:hypothetical protein [Edaphobacter sp.]